MPGYEVSNLGRARSLPRFVSNGTPRRGRVLRQEKTSNGYLRVCVSVGDRKRHVLVHRAVADAFHGMCPDGMQVRHLDGTRDNNQAENLAWGTASENMRDRRRHGTDFNANKETCPRNHRLSEPNLRASELRHGRRNCLACHRAHARATRNPAIQFAAEADREYAVIVRGR